MMWSHRWVYRAQALYRPMSGPIQAKWGDGSIFSSDNEQGRFPTALLIFPCPSPVSHSILTLLPSTKKCQGCSDENRIPPRVKGLFHHLRYRKTYRQLDFSRGSPQCVRSLCICSPGRIVRDASFLPAPCHQGKVWDGAEGLSILAGPCLEKQTPIGSTWGSCARGYPL